jgi:hypothetical protein
MKGVKLELSRETQYLGVVLDDKLLRNFLIKKLKKEPSNLL